ncbi:MAG: Gfo/Idh/MocA family oxidoreductase [Gammaproteobacteria bacterium]|nr:Gfo/Idh/MocA family oxidoreductase [Gammaproteobacteria bacterium]
MSDLLRIGTLGAAGIAPAALTDPAAKNDDVVVAAVAARDRTRAEAFAAQHNIETVYNSYDEVIADPSLDAIYNPLPISHHREYSIKALRAGKHVLCEKSFSLNAAEAREMAAVADETGFVLIEAFHYRYHPVFQKALEFVDAGELGQLQHIDAQFVVGTPPKTNIRMIYETGGGATMDMGCYPMSWLRHITRQEPKVTAATAVEGDPQIDLRLEVEYELADGVTARTVGAMNERTFVADMRITGERGELYVRNPLVPQHGNQVKLTIDGETKFDEELTRRPTYEYQLEAFVDAIKNGTKLPTDAHDAIKQMELIDAAYSAAGLKPRGT